MGSEKGGNWRFQKPSTRSSLHSYRRSSGVRVTAGRPERGGSEGWAAPHPPAATHLAVFLHCSWSRAPCWSRWPPVTCWSQAKSSAPARLGGSAGRTARAGPAGNPAALRHRSQPAARPPWPPCCYGNDVHCDPEAVDARREGNPKGGHRVAGEEGACACPCSSR